MHNLALDNIALQNLIAAITSMQGDAFKQRHNHQRDTPRYNPHNNHYSNRRDFQRNNRIHRNGSCSSQSPLRKRRCYNCKGNGHLSATCASPPTTVTLIYRNLDKSRSQSFHSSSSAGINTNLRDTNLRDSILRDTDLRDTNLRDSILRDSILRDPILRDTDLRDTNLRDSILRDSILRDPILRDTDLRDPILRDTHLRDTHLRDTHLRDTNLRDINLRDINLRDTTLRDTNPQYTNLHDYNLQYTNLRDLTPSTHRSSTFHNIPYDISSQPPSLLQPYISTTCSVPNNPDMKESYATPTAITTASRSLSDQNQLRSNIPRSPYCNSEHPFRMLSRNPYRHPVTSTSVKFSNASTPTIDRIHTNSKEADSQTSSDSASTIYLPRAVKLHCNDIPSDVSANSDTENRTTQMPFCNPSELSRQDVLPLSPSDAFDDNDPIVNTYVPNKLIISLSKPCYPSSYETGNYNDFRI
ncbi:hypothetical protein DAKH74_050190 [Maudiozyma humilis]|uniref:CCHC-type domain-containing protein n=1 Tax=Maudiozyma humilis TaxID=51915 RepID=A0AAV5S6Q3_MAUHU|nr:hypothetical protein DAKH74_050190 [Kazachstania humilis]